MTLTKNFEHLTREIANCRLCGSDKLRTVFSLGEQYINDFVPLERIGTGLKAPLELVWCDDCTLLQLRHTAPQEILYSRYYWYRSGVTATMRRALRDITEQLESMITLRKDDVVLDIGANDGTLLASYEAPCMRIGCDPANNLVDLLRANADYVMHDFWNYKEYERLAADWGISSKAKIVTAIGMFYDLDDPNAFIADARKALADDGIFIAQLMCLASMIEKNDVGNICHEHLEYYSLESLKRLFETNGLEIFKLEENDVNGGSYRIFARHLHGGSISLPEEYSFGDVLDFGKRIGKNRDRCRAFIVDEVAKGKSVWVYGASTKGNVILQYYGLDHTLITAASEKSPEKWGKYTAGTWIPIVSEEEARMAQPDYFLVLPWAFLSEFYEREREWREGGGKFLVPLPEFGVVP